MEENELLRLFKHFVYTRLKEHVTKFFQSLRTKEKKMKKILGVLLLFLSIIHGPASIAMLPGGEGSSRDEFSAGDLPAAMRRLLNAVEEIPISRYSIHHGGSNSTSFEGVDRNDAKAHLSALRVHSTCSDRCRKLITPLIESLENHAHREVGQHNWFHLSHNIVTRLKEVKSTLAKEILEEEKIRRDREDKTRELASSLERERREKSALEEEVRQAVSMVEELKELLKVSENARKEDRREAAAREERYMQMFELLQEQLAKLPPPPPPTPPSSS